MGPVLFLYWGRRGLNQFVFELANTARRKMGDALHLSLSRQNEEFGRFAEFGDAVVPVTTFRHSVEAVAGLARVRQLHRLIESTIKERRIERVVNIMPHVLSPFVTDAIGRTGARYTSILHDAHRHSGDRSSWANTIKYVDARKADVVVTLSQSVADLAISQGIAPASRIRSLFHPRLTFQPFLEPPSYSPREPLKLLLLGRMMRYKGVDMLLAAIELLRDRNVHVELSIMGEGRIALSRQRVADLGVSVHNRWLDNADFARAFANNHAVVIPYSNASQSGIAAAAHGASLPVIAFPVGGITEQVADGQTGLLARGLDAEALAEAIRTLSATQGLHGRLRHGVALTAQGFSMERFLDLLLE